MEKSFEKSKVNFIGRTLLHMGIGLLLTFVAAYLTPMILDRISYGIIIGASIVEIGLVLYFARAGGKISILHQSMQDKRG